MELQEKLRGVYFFETSETPNQILLLARIAVLSPRHNMKISGVFNKERFIAIFVDTWIAIALTFFLMIVIRDWRSEIKLPLLVLVYIGYFIVFEVLFSRTPGKYFQGLIVRRLDGSKIGWKEALLRGVMIPFELNPFAFGGIPAGIAVMSSERKQRLGDMLAGTVVVSDKLDLNAVVPPEEMPDLYKPPPPPEPENLR